MCLSLNRQPLACTGRVDERWAFQKEDSWAGEWFTTAVLRLEMLRKCDRENRAKRSVGQHDGSKISTALAKLKIKPRLD